MIAELDTSFTREEKAILIEHRDVDVKLYVQIDRLVYKGIKDGEVSAEVLENPRRMIRVGGLYLLELDNQPNEWHMGGIENDSTYSFWGSYGDLATAIKSL